jgi:hypothetical protein
MVVPLLSDWNLEQSRSSIASQTKAVQSVDKGLHLSRGGCLLHAVHRPAPQTLLIRQVFRFKQGMIGNLVPVYTTRLFNYVVGLSSPRNTACMLLNSVVPTK